jgi:hypothetical protein
VIVDNDDAQMRGWISLSNEAAQTAADIDRLIARGDDHRYFWRATGWRRFGRLEPWQQAALPESPHDQPSHDREPDRRQQKVQGSTGQLQLGFVASIRGGSFGFRNDHRPPLPR